MLDYNNYYLYSQSSCHLGCWLRWTKKQRCTWASSGEYGWTIKIMSVWVVATNIIITC